MQAKPNGHSPIEPYPLPPLEEEDSMPPRSEEIAVVIEHLQSLNLRQAERDRAAESQAAQQTMLLMKVVEKLDGGKDRTALPNWLMPIIAALMFTAGGFVYNTVDRRISDNKADYIQQRAEDSTELRILRTYVIQLTLEMNKKGMQVPPIPETKK